MLRPLPHASAPPRSATRLSRTQPGDSCVMAVEFFFGVCPLSSAVLLFSSLALCATGVIAMLARGG